MELDKSYGIWYSKHKETYEVFGDGYVVDYVDDVAYQLYLTYMKENTFGEIILNQISFLKTPRLIEQYYNKSIQIVRTEKIERIKKNNK